MARGGARPGSGRKPWTDEQKAAAKARREAALSKPIIEGPAPKAFAETKSPTSTPPITIDDLRALEEISKRYAKNKGRTADNSPFNFPKFPEAAIPPKNQTMAMDNGLVGAMNYGNTAWMGAEVINGVAGEGLVFLGYSILAEMAQRPEFRVMSETIADDATRKWIDFDVVGDARIEREKREKDPEGYDESRANPDDRKKRAKESGKLEKIKRLRDDQIRLGVKDKFYEMARGDGFFGRMHLFLDIHTNGEPSNAELATSIGDSWDQVSKTKVPKDSFKALRSIEPVWTYPLNYNANDPLRDDWYNPQVWFVMGKEIHGSRLQTFIGHPVPDILKPAYAFGGLSLTQMAKPYVDIWLQTRQSVADLIHSFSVMVLMTDMAQMLQPNNVGAVLARAAMFNMLRDNNGLYVLNKNTEDFKNVSASLSGLHELQAQAQEHMASVHRIPLVKFTGIQPSGLNASSEGEIKVYDDTIMAYQSRFIQPNLTKIINFEQLSLFGEIDPEITFHFEPLREMTQAEKGQKQKDDADRDQKYVDMGAIAPGEVRKIIVDDPELPYTGLDPEDVPDLMGEEMDGLQIPGAHPDGGEGDDKDEDSKGGGANDAAIPFVASDAEWKESDHPRAPNGEFGSGGGGGKKKDTASGARSAVLKVFPEAAEHFKNADFHNSMVNRFNERVTKAGGKALSPDEYQVMRQYMGYGSVAINRPLRVGGGTKEHQQVVDLMDAGLRKLPKYDGVATRGLNLPESEMKRFMAEAQPGKTIKNPAYSSAAVGDKVAKNFSDSNVRMTIKSNGAARHFSMMSAFGKDESEVIFPRNTEFKITSVKTKGSKVHIQAEVVPTKGGAKDQATDENKGDGEPEEIAPDVFILAHDEARFEESKHPRDQDGQFSSTGGGGGGSSADPEPASFKSKKDHIGHLLSKGTTPKEVMQAMGWPSVSMPQQAASLGVKLKKYKEDGVTKYKSRPMTPEEQAEVDAAKAAKKAARGPVAGKRGRAAADPETWSLFEFLASKGGIKPTADLQSIFGNKRGPFVPGFGPLMRPGGISMEDALIFAKENSYVFDPNDIQHVAGAKNEGEATVRWQDLQDMISKENSGDKQYKITAAPQETKVDAEEESRHIIDALHREMAAVGGKVDPALEDRVAQIIQKEGETDVLAAYERAVMEDHDRYEGELDGRRAADIQSEDWDVYPESASEYGEDPFSEWGEAGSSEPIPF